MGFKVLASMSSQLSDETMNEVFHCLVQLRENTDWNIVKDTMGVSSAAVAEKIFVKTWESFRRKTIRMQERAAAATAIKEGDAISGEPDKLDKDAREVEEATMKSATRVARKAAKNAARKAARKAGRKAAKKEANRKFTM
jgi:hypothetical protein